MTIKTIIFDLGGVLLNLNFDLTANAFAELGAKDFGTHFFTDEIKALRLDYEIGRISAKEFRTRIKQSMELDISDLEFDKAWNAMLLDIPAERFELLKTLHARYPLYLLSNTNEIHYDELLRIYRRDQGAHDFHDYFTGQYYSHKEQQRKPEQRFYRMVLDNHQLTPQETVFIDDALENVQVAKELGMHGIHLSPEKSIVNLLKYLDELN